MRDFYHKFRFVNLRCQGQPLGGRRIDRKSPRLSPNESCVRVSRVVKLIDTAA